MNTLNVKRIGDLYELHEVEYPSAGIQWNLVKANWKNGEFIERKIEPEIIKEYETKPTQSQLDEEITLNDWSRWNVQPLTEGQRIEISEAIYWHLLECLPPRKYNGSYFEVGEPDHHDKNGKPIHRACWIENGKFYTGYPRQ